MATNRIGHFFYLDQSPHVQESFVLTVTYREKELDLPAVLHVFPHTHKIAVLAGQQEILFEPDEERNYRAVLSPEEAAQVNLDRNLLKAIAEALEAAFKD